MAAVKSRESAFDSAADLIVRGGTVFDGSGGEPFAADGAINHATSSDGARICFLTTGSGPPIILLPGVLSTAEDYARFAATLGERYTVHAVQRRRCRSRPLKRRSDGVNAAWRPAPSP